MYRNARQILKVVTATFPSFEDAGPSVNCETMASDFEVLSCQWRGIEQQFRQIKPEDTNQWIENVAKVTIPLFN